jgi:hypothetical protein
MDGIGKVYPFPEGKHEPDDQIFYNRFKQVVSAASMRLSNKELTCLLLIARTDKRELLPEMAKNYGSNYGLAEARGRWIKERLPPEFGTVTVLVLTSGPMNTGPRVSPDAMAMDRSVDVYTCGEQSPKKASR